MVLHFANRTAAETDLTAHGFRKLPNGIFAKDGFLVSIFTIPGSEMVQAAYRAV